MSGFGEGFTLFVNGLGDGFFEFIRKIVGQPSLRRQQVDTARSYEKLLTRFADTNANAGGGIGEYGVRIQQLKQHGQAMQNDLNRMSAQFARMKDQTTPQAVALQRQILLQARLVTSNKSLLANAQKQLVDMQARQQDSMMRQQDLDFKRQESAFNDEALVERGDLAQMREDVAKSQLAARGVIQGGSGRLVDHTSEMERQVGRMEGRAATYEQMLGGSTSPAETFNLGDEVSGLSAEEQATLQAAFKEAGMTLPAATSSDQTAASAGS